MVREVLMLFCGPGGIISLRVSKIWKHSFISRVQPTVYTNPSRKQSFWKRSSNRRNLKTTSLRFSVDGKHFKNESFQKGWHHDNNVIFFTLVFLNHRSIMTCYSCVFEFLGVVWTENTWCVFRMKPLVFKFVPRSLDGALTVYGNIIQGHLWGC